MDLLTSKSTSDPEGYLAHPVNAYKLVKRLNTDWLELENLVLQDTTNGEELQGSRDQEVTSCPPWNVKAAHSAGALNVIAKF